ncbi:hypothetical protein [Corynebacterium variabile]|uniref:hypothetical protein n=1 Tax=Corynebacterium variabile TaxID=1727 RepID=UPI003FD0F7B3
MARNDRRDWGEVQRRKTAKGWRYYPRYRLPGTDRRFTPGVAFETRGAADGWLRSERERWEDAVATGTIAQWLPPREFRAAAVVERERAAVTVADMIGRWIAYKAVTSWEESTRQTVERQLTLRVLDVDGNAGRFATLPLVDVKRRDANEWWSAVWAQFPDTAATNNAAKKHVTAAFRWAAREELIPASPVDLESRRVKVGQGATRSDLPTIADIRMILEATPERYRFPTALALVHGLRTQEVLGLRRWQVKCSVDADGAVSWVVDLSDRERVRAAVRLMVDGKQQMVDKGLKTEDSYRVVPVFPEFNELCERHMRLYAAPGAEGVVVVTRNGTRLLDTGWNTTLSRAAGRAADALVEGLPEGEAAVVRKRVTDVRKHDGRRFVATELLEAGMTPVAAGAFIGDRNAAVIQEHYLRQTAERTAEGLARVAERLRGSGE